MIMRRTVPVLIALMALVISGCGSSDAGASTPASLEVSTSSGHLKGLAAGTTRQFLGVRYAEPPTGERRWTLPQPLATTDEQVDATVPGSRCAQMAVQPGAEPSTDEDCLFLNVTTPRAQSDEPLPVMVWWHGGGYTTGAGSEYDAQRMATEGNVIVVTVNYRLGMFGYLGLPGLEGSGNFGFADQIASLQWVNENAAAFGGDPDNVTVFGESAGGMSTCALLTSPVAAGLIDKAVIMSGACGLHWPTGALYPGVPAQAPYTGLSDNEANGVGVADGLECAGPHQVDCLRRLSADRLVPLGDKFSNQLAYGTDLLPRDPAEAVRDGDALAIPVIAGGNQDEQRSFVGGAIMADPTSITADSYPSLLAGAFGADSPRVADRYPLSNFKSPGLAWATVTTDAAWSCPTTRTARALAAKAPVYTYEFADRTAPNVNGIIVPDLPQGAAHATDLPYWFDLLGKDLLNKPAQKSLASTMIDYITTFSHTGVPAASDSPDWPKTTTADTPVMQFNGSGPRVVDTDSAHDCNFWNSL